MAHFNGNGRQFDHGIAISSHELWPEYHQAPIYGCVWNRVPQNPMVFYHHCSIKNSPELAKDTKKNQTSSNTPMSFVSHSATMKYHDVYSYNLSPSFMAINHPSALWNDPFHVHPNIISLLISLIDSICPLFLVKAVKAPGFFLVKPPFGAPQNQKKTQLTEETRPVLAVEPGRTCPHQAWQRPGRLSAGPEGPWGFGRMHRDAGCPVMAICKGKMARTPPNYGYFKRGWWSLKMMNQWMEWDVLP